MYLSVVSGIQVAPQVLISSALLMLPFITSVTVVTAGIIAPRILGLGALDQIMILPAF